MSEAGPKPGEQGSDSISTPDFEGATGAVFGGDGPDQVEQDLRTQEARAGAALPRRIGRGISRIFERVSGGVKLGAERASQLANSVVSKAANVKVFGQNLTNSLDDALHHKNEIVTGAVQYALSHKAEIVTGAVAGGLGKAVARSVLVGTGGFLATAAIGAAGGALAGGAKEYLRQRREGIQINEAEKTLIIAGLKNEFRRIKAADKRKIRDGALRGAVFGAIGGVIGAEITEFVANVANNEWVQGQMSQIRVPEMKLPEVKVPAGPPPSVPPMHAAGFPAAEPLSTPVSPTEVAAVPAAPSVEPSATPAPAIATPTVVEPAPTPSPIATPTAVSTPEPTTTPTVSPTASPTGTPIPTETPRPLPTGTPTSELAPAPAVQPPAAAPTGPEVAAAAPPVGGPEAPPAAPPVPPAPEPARVLPGAEPAAAQPVLPKTPEIPAVPETPESIPPTNALNGAKISGSVLDNSLTYNDKPWILLDNGTKNISGLFQTVGEAGSIDKQALAANLQKATTLWVHGDLQPSTHPDLWRIFHLSNGTASVYNDLLNRDTLKSLTNLGIAVK